MTSAAEIKLRAPRRIGEISKTLEKAHKTGRGSKVRIPSGGKSKSYTLKAAGISTSTANRCEKISDIPAETFDSFIAGKRDKNQPA